jgi:hypothetical protein
LAFATVIDVGRLFGFSISTTVSSRYTQPAAGAVTCSGATSNFGRDLRFDGALGVSEVSFTFALGI